jgi:hypothetical protein
MPAFRQASFMNPGTGSAGVGVGRQPTHCCLTTVQIPRQEAVIGAAFALMSVCLSVASRRRSELLRLLVLSLHFGR